jgi:type I restriction-modification system DNA methylase subunit
MANLFGKNRLRGIAEQIETDDIADFLKIVKTWQADYHTGSLRGDKETSREQSYNQDFFIKILGYQEKPASPYSFEPKATTSMGQLPDAVISYSELTGDIDNIAAVVELKGAAVDLDRPQRREGNMSPVQQGFKYKTQYRNCPFVIVSNFWEFRLYRDNLLDYELWTLDDLVNPANDYLLFKTWFALLRRENFTTEKGFSKTENLLSDIRIEQEEIGKKFYKVYHSARLELLRDIYQRNAQIKRNIETGIEKAQKIIDRIVFAAFAEDRGLLPDNILQQVLKAADRSEFGGSLWNTFKGFFEAIDIGSQKLDIPGGYNGGLFKRDDALNNLQIGDEPLRAVAALGNYNFAEDLSVTILGHIFEQSISDLEEIKNKVNEAQNLEILNHSRRKRDGIFYTPDYIVRYIVENTLGTYLREEEERLKIEFRLKGDINDSNYAQRERKAYIKYNEFLSNVKVVDPACGSGAFLVYVFDYLLAEHTRVGKILELDKGIASFGEVYKNILQRNIYGVDLNEESVEITKLSLWLKSAQKGKKLTSLDSNIKCGNSLIAEPDVAGKKAFSWGEEFEEIMKGGGFDVVVGNPPYVRQELIKDQVPYLSSHYASHSGKADLYVYFFELATRLLKDNGFFGFISSGKFIEANYGKPLIEYLTKSVKFESIVNFGDLEVFEGVTAYPLIMIARKSQMSGTFKYTKIDSLNFGSIDSAVSKDSVDQTMGGFIENSHKFHDPKVSSLLSHIRVDSVGFTELFPAPTIGIKTGLNKAYQTSVGLPYVFGRDIKKYQPVEGSGIIFPYKWTSSGYELLPENEVPELERLLSYKQELSQRAIISEGISSGVKKWYEYQQINKQLNFDLKYIVYPNVSLGTNFTFSEGNIIDMTGFIIPSHSRYLLAVLNSSLFRFFIQHTAISRRGGYHEFKNQYITQFPVKKVGDDKIKEFESRVDARLERSKELDILSKRFKQLIGTDLKGSSWPIKINKWWVLEYSDFVSALKLNMSYEQKDELFSLFDKYRSECVELDNQTKKIDMELDQLVYSIYNLNPQEIALIENN